VGDFACQGRAARQKDSVGEAERPRDAANRCAMAEAEQKFEVAVYNQEVVEAMAKGLRHRHLKDDWAENQYFQITAESPDAARRKIEARYPPDNGYVISSIEAVKDDKY
jgi:hypothetical protein